MPVEANPNNLHHFFGANNEYIIVNPFLTDTSDWYLAVNPRSPLNGIDWFMVLFLRGKTFPELFLQDQPTVGTVFDFDKLRWKARFEFGTTFVDTRGAYKEVV